jgi:hypothetical protein
MSRRHARGVPGAAHLDALIQGWSYLQLAVEAPQRVAGWDAVVMTAASATQARLYTRQIEVARRHGRLPLPTKTLVVADRGGHRIGSGGATLNALGALARAWPNVDTARRCVLLVHAGGDSRRVPRANLLGKPFIPFPLLADDAIRLGEFLPDMEPQFGHHGLVVPLPRADEELDRFARQPGLDRDRLTGLALQSAEKPADDQGGVLALLDAVKPGEVALEKAGQTVGAVTDGVGRDGGVAQKGLGLGVLQ